MVLDFEDIGPVLIRLHTARGVDFRQYRKSTLRRRIARRMTARNCPDLSAYLAVLDRDVDEYDLLLRDLTIKYTEFFRDSQVYDIIRNVILPEITSSSRRDKTVAIWSAGSATGEEAYSLASMIREVEKPAHRLDEAVIIGTDVDPFAVSAAGEGRYVRQLLPNVPDGCPEGCFVQDGACVCAGERLKSIVRFEVHDLISPQALDNIKAIWPGTFDLILCRNVLVYLNRPAQAQVLDLCCNMLSPGGYLVLGTREYMPNSLLTRLSVCDAKARVFRLMPEQQTGG